jgi:hypothetical protein
MLPCPSPDEKVKLKCKSRIDYLLHHPFFREKRCDEAISSSSISPDEKGRAFFLNMDAHMEMFLHTKLRETPCNPMLGCRNRLHVGCRPFIKKFII